MWGRAAGVRQGGGSAQGLRRRAVGGTQKGVPGSPTAVDVWGAALRHSSSRSSTAGSSPGSSLSLPGLGPPLPDLIPAPLMAEKHPLSTHLFVHPHLYVPRIYRPFLFLLSLSTCPHFSHPRTPPGPPSPHTHACQREAPLPSLSPSVFPGTLLWVEVGTGHSCFLLGSASWRSYCLRYAVVTFRRRVGSSWAPGAYTHLD